MMQHKTKSNAIAHCPFTDVHKHIFCCTFFFFKLILLDFLLVFFHGALLTFTYCSIFALSHC